MFSPIFKLKNKYIAIIACVLFLSPNLGNAIPKDTKDDRTPAQLATNKQATATNDQQWTLWKSDNRQSVSYRKSETSALVEIKAQAQFDSSISGFLLFIQDTENIPNWLDNLQYSIVIKQFSAQENLFVNKFKGFLMVSDRDMAVRSRYWQNLDGSVEIAVSDAGTEVELTKNTIRMEVINAHWTIKPIANTSDKPLIEIEYVFTVDPKGDLPMWIHKGASLSGIWKTLNNLQKQLPQSLWQHKRLANIVEPSYAQD